MYPVDFFLRGIITLLNRNGPAHHRMHWNPQWHDPNVESEELMEQTTRERSPEEERHCKAHAFLKLHLPLPQPSCSLVHAKDVILPEGEDRDQGRSTAYSHFHEPLAASKDQGGLAWHRFKGLTGTTYDQHDGGASTSTQVQLAGSPAGTLNAKSHQVLTEQWDAKVDSQCHKSHINPWEKIGEPCRICREICQSSKTDDTMRMVAEYVPTSRIKLDSPRQAHGEVRSEVPPKTPLSQGW
mmetsp:Transcript_32948/g.60305  ORF Transcript_32948/g.60305 Transcript_32948/m.60305 type:complete len:240 (+) Transcript_32948:271-990(+)